MITKKNNPFFSIVTVTLNDENNLLKTINSVKSQTFKDIELIVIDGESKDKTLEQIEKNSSVITKWLSEKDQGIYQAMNKGINLAEGYYTLFLNSGDTFLNRNGLEEVHGFIKKTNADIFYTDYISNNKKIKQKLSLAYLTRKMICHQTIFYNTLFLKRTKFCENMRYAADYAHLLTNYRSLHHKKINLTLINYDLNGISSNPKNYYKIWNERLIALKKSNINPVLKFFMIAYATLAKTVRERKK